MNGNSNMNIPSDVIVVNNFELFLLNISRIMHNKP